VKIKWLGQSCFLITSASGVKLMTDPYTPQNGLKYGEINEAADVVTVSHEHYDHNNVRAVKGKPQLVRNSGEVKGIGITAVPAFHDAEGGRTRGSNTIFCYNIDSMRLCHCGDLGQVPDGKQLVEIGKVDILMIPAGGYFTLDPGEANRVVDKINPKVVIPMHFATAKTSIPFQDAEAFLRDSPNVKRLGASEVEFTSANLPQNRETIVLEPAR
jgi:L-ascorbate metabolism protein UlaG (beta-lactamase superfamily)